MDNNKLANPKKKILLHICCGPCSTSVIERLSDEYDITGFFYNPNIHPKKEYARRLESLKIVAEKTGLRLFIGEYNTAKWFELVKGLESEPEGGKRCEVCFAMRLKETIKFAKQNGFDLITTTLSISPRKNADMINSIGTKLANEAGIQFLEANFKKKNGFLRSVMLSKEYGLYRQNYCGCVFSMRK